MLGPLRGKRLFPALAAGAILLAGCAQSGATVQGQDIHHLYVIITILAAPVFVVVEGLLLFLIVRYRKRDEATPPQTAGRGRALVIFFAIPTIIVSVLYFFGETTLATVQKQAPSPQVTIRVEGFQW